MEKLEDDWKRANHDNRNQEFGLRLETHNYALMAAVVALIILMILITVVVISRSRPFRCFTIFCRKRRTDLANTFEMTDLKSDREQNKFEIFSSDTIEEETEGTPVATEGQRRLSRIIDTLGGSRMSIRKNSRGSP